MDTREVSQRTQKVLNMPWFENIPRLGPKMAALPETDTGCVADAPAAGYATCTHPPMLNSLAVCRADLNCGLR